MNLIVDNLAIEYKDDGEGKVLLFLHGWGDNLHTFDNLLPELIKKYRVIRLDFPGFGKSEKPKRAWDLSEYVNFVYSFLTKLEVKPDVILGHSFGGRVAIKGVGTKALKTSKLILLDAAGVAQRKTSKNMILGILARIAKILLIIPPFYFWREPIKRRLYSLIGSDYYEANDLKGTFVKVINEDLSLYAEKIDLPTLLLWGADDQATHVSEGVKLNNLIKTSKLKVMPDAGHFVHQQKPDEVVCLIKEFIND